MTDTEHIATSSSNEEEKLNIYKHDSRTVRSARLPSVRESESSNVRLVKSDTVSVCTARQSLQMNI